MKKRLLFALCLTALFVGANAQETTFSYDFDNNSFDGWSGYDADGDGHTWELHNSSVSGGFDGSYGLYSSCYNMGELTPDNYIYTTNSYLITSTSRLYFMHRQSDFVYYQENFGVIVSEDGLNFVEIWSMRYTEPLPNEKWSEETIDLSEFAGKNIYIGFRHYDCDGSVANGIRIDNVELISDGESVEENALALNVYPNPVESTLLIETNENVTDISILTANGTSVYNGNYKEEGIEVSDYKTGIYFVIINTENSNFVKKFIKK